MKVAIIVFSPSGSTLKVGGMLKESLLGKNAEVQLINIARCEEIFVKHNIEQYLEDTIETHDLLCVGGPVYTHHLHYNVQDLIRRLPRPGNGWGKLAVPFITWGGINSGVALQEAGNLLRKSGRTVVSGMKVNSFHCFSSLKKISVKVNEGMPGDEALPLIEDLATRIIKLADVEPQECPDASRELDYQSRKVKIKAKLIFKEKFWQRHIYPKLVFHHDKCTKCGLCAKVCSVQRIDMNGDGPIIAKENPECIHCVRCISNCPVDAIDFDADWSKWNRVFAKAALGLGPLPSNEFPKSAVYPIRSELQRVQRGSDPLSHPRKRSAGLGAHEEKAHIFRMWAF